MRSAKHIKRYTTIGTAHEQGKTSGVIASGITADLLDLPIGPLSTKTFRPPYTPVAFAALAGCDRGALFDRERTTALHDWHVTQGAVSEDVGQWKRPRHYRLGGGAALESMDAAVLRECATTCGGVGILDGSTLGKIDVRGRRRRRAAGPDLYKPREQPEGRFDPVRRDVWRRRNGG
jgi:sarcosine oxidase subunit alpha